MQESINYRLLKLEFHCSKRFSEWHVFFKIQENDMYDHVVHRSVLALSYLKPQWLTIYAQVVAVPVSGESARLVTLTGAKLGQIMAGGQQRLLIAANRTLQQQQLQKQKRPQLQKQKQQILTSTGQETGVTTTKNEGSQLPAQQDHGN